MSKIKTNISIDEDVHKKAKIYIIKNDISNFSSFVEDLIKKEMIEDG